MKTFIKVLLLGMLVGCNASQTNKSLLVLPEITASDVQKVTDVEAVVEKELAEINFEELSIKEPNPGDVSSQSMGYLLTKLRKLVTPKHLSLFTSDVISDNDEKDLFANYLGTHGHCHQFRVFEKYNDPRNEKVKWMSSILTIPQKSKEAMKVQAGVVLAPTLDGHNSLLETALWAELCKSSISSIMPESTYVKDYYFKWKKIHFDPSPDPESVEEVDIFEKSMKNYVKVLEKQIKILKNFETLKTTTDQSILELNVMPVSFNRVGVWASSLGALASSVILGKDPSLKGAVLTVGGGGLPYILSKSQIRIFRETRSDHMKHFDIKTIEEYEKFLTPHIETDPLRFVSSELRDKVFMMMAGKDTSVPTKAQVDLWEQYGKPRRIMIKFNHIGTLLYTAWFKKSGKKEAVTFLKEKLIN